MRGSLSEVNLALVLRDLIRDHKTGKLVLQNGSVEKRLYLITGALTHAESNVPEEGLAYRLIDAGLLTADGLREAQAEVAPGHSLAAALVATNLVAKPALERERRGLAEVIILGSFDLTAGIYQYHDGETTNDGQFRLNTAALILEGVRRMFNFDPVKTQMLEDGRLLQPRVDPTQLRLEPTEGFILSRVDGSYTAAMICSLSIISEDMTCRILYGLLAAGAIEYNTGSATPRAPLRSVAGAVAPRVSPPQRPPDAAPPSRPQVAPPPRQVVPPPSARPPIPSPQRPPPAAPTRAPAEPSRPVPGITRPRIERAENPPPAAAAPPKVERFTPDPSRPGATRPRVEAFTPEPSEQRPAQPRVEAFVPDSASGSGRVGARVEPYQPTGAAPGGRAADPAGSATATSPRERTAEIDRLFNSLDALEPQAILGVERGAPADRVDRAFRDLRARFHPSLNAWITDDSLRSKLVFVFAKISAAYHALSDEEQRAAFDREYDADSLTSGTHISMAFARTARQREFDDRLHESDELYRQAVKLFEGQRLHDARDRIIKALKLNDQNPTYFALAARITMLNPNMRWQKESEGYWRRAIALDRWNADYHVGLGIQYKTGRMDVKAKKEFIRALELDPLNAVALSEVPIRERPERIEMPKRADEPEIEPDS